MSSALSRYESRRPALTGGVILGWLLCAGLYMKYLASYEDGVYYQASMAWYQLPTMTPDLILAGTLGGTFFTTLLGLILYAWWVKAQFAASVTPPGDIEPIGEIVSDDRLVGEWQQPPTSEHQPQDEWPSLSRGGDVNYLSYGR